MFDQLKELIIQLLDKFAFLVIVEEYERVVVLRFGKFHRSLEPGLHWVWPLMIEKALNENVVPRIYNLDAQSLTTTDGKSVVVSGNVLAQITDIRKALLGVEHANDAIKNVCVSEIARAVTRSPWSELTSESFGEALTAACRKRGWKWGIEIMEVQLSDVATVRSLRLFHDNSYKV